MQKNINELKEVLTDFFISEYSYTKGEAKEDIKELERTKKLQIAYTTLGDNNELEIDVFVNIEKNRLEQVISGIKIQKIELTEYGTLKNMIDDLECCDFESLTRLDKFDINDLIIEDKRTRNT